MSVQVEIADGLFIVRYGAYFTTEDIVAAMVAAMEDPAFAPPMPVVVDTRASRESASHDELRRRAEMIGARSDLFGPRIAVVVARPMQLGQARQAGAYVENRGLSLATFEDETEACAWARGEAELPGV